MLQPYEVEYCFECDFFKGSNKCRNNQWTQTVRKEGKTSNSSKIDWKVMKAVY